MNEIREGMLFRDVIQNRTLEKTWIFTFGGGKIIRGIEANGVKVWFPKKLRTVKDKLEKKLLGGMRLKRMEGDEPQFFLVQEDQFSGKDTNNTLNTPNILKLHEAIAVVLISKTNRTASLHEITKEIAERELYRQQNGEGTFPPESQIRLRTHPNTKGGKTYAHIFEFIEPDMVRIRDNK